MSGNFPPTANALDQAFWDRMRLIPFNVRIEQADQNPLLIPELLGERDGILAWAVEGLMAYHREKLLPPAAVVAGSAEYREDSNALRDWVDERCELDTDAVIEAARLRADYDRWAADHRVQHRVPLGKTWAESLKRLGCQQGGDARGRLRIDGRHVQAWRGIRLLPVDSHGGQEI